MSTFKNKKKLRTIEAQIVKKLKNNETRPKFTEKACTVRARIGAYRRESIFCRHCTVLSS